VVIFGGKQRAVEALVRSYLERARECVQVFVDGIDIWLREARSMDDVLDHANRAESQADDVRRELCMLLYGKALFPESRGDILGLVEAVDKVPNRAEAIIQRLKSQQIGPPGPDLEDGFRILVACAHECTQVMFEGAMVLFTDHHAAIDLSNRVDVLESKTDRAEMDLIERVFNSNRASLSKILYRDVVMDIGGLADRAEDASDRIRVIAIKRKY